METLPSDIDVAYLFSLSNVDWKKNFTVPYGKTITYFCVHTYDYETHCIDEMSQITVITPVAG